MLDRLPFARLIGCDTEFVPTAGERVLPVCLVARELRSGHVWRVMMGEFGPKPPFPIDKQTLLIAYSAPAELSVFEALQWRRPARLLDLFAEHRVNINGLPSEDRELWKQRGAMRYYGLDPVPAALKEDLYAVWKPGRPSTTTNWSRS
jgi:DNA polymerase-1